MRLFILFFISLFTCLETFGQILFKEDATLFGIGVTCGTTYLGNGISFVDYDDDGWDDISITTANGLQPQFYKNNSGTFTADFLNLPNLNYQTKQINWVDFDNDGDKDLFITSDTNGNRLLENDGSFNFSDITISAGLPNANMFTFGSSWGDINNDGYLDIYVSNRDITGVNSNKLYKNNGNATFSDISISAGVDLVSLSFCSAFLDYNNDGYQDIYISNDKTYTTNVLYKNNGDETFDDVSQISETDIAIDAMSVTVEDFNSDGWVDMYITNGPQGNVFLKNNGDGTFVDIAETSGTLFNSLGWGASFLDAENDGDIDLYVSGEVNGSNPSYISAAFYENLGNEIFNIPSDAGFDGDTGSSLSNAIGDIDNDGFPEIVVSNNNNEDIFLWHNITISDNNWLKVKLEGTISNRDGIGSVMEIFSNGNKQYRHVLLGEGYLSQNSNTEIFGLGGQTSVDYLKVTWLSGIVDYFYNVSANQLIEVTEGTGTLSISPNAPDSVQLFPNPVEDMLYIHATHRIEAYQVFDVLGKTVLQGRGNNNINYIDFSDLPKGVYIAKLSINDNFLMRKIIKK